MPNSAPTHRPTFAALNERASDRRSRTISYGYAWQRERRVYLQDHPYCVMCALVKRVALAVVVDHVVPHRGDSVRFWDQDNWQGLCKPHHDSTKQAAERSGHLDLGFD